MNRSHESPTKLDDCASKLEQLQLEIAHIQQRNACVEMDKAWETSRLRVVFLILLTYVVTATVFWSIGSPNPFLNALIPTTGYYLSTLSLPIVKKWWIQRKRKQDVAK